MYIIKLIKKKALIIFILGLFLSFFFQSSVLQAMELDLTSAKNSVGKRFASKFCEAKEKDFPQNLQVSLH